MKHLFFGIALLISSISLFAQQLPNADFEDWSGSTFDGAAQPKDWYFSNVTQFGFKFNFAHRETGRTGKYCIMAQDQEIGAAGITETSPGYASLGKPWVYIESLTKVNQATAGDAGGISWTYRPDTMEVWIKRTGNNTHRENFNIIFYSWKGTSRGTSYKGKNGNCTSTTQTDEESDIRLSTDGNECGTAQKAQQIAEGWWKEMKTYSDWTCLKIPICYMSNDVPEKCNVIFSASNYPNFRANSGLYAGNSLYVDDVRLIYSSRIEKLYIDGIAWNGFNPNTEEEQVYSLGENATTVPDIYAMRGSGSFTNSKNQTATFVGRRLQGNEIEIKKGAVGEVTTITVRAEDGSSTTTYRIRFTKAASSNTQIAGLWLKSSDSDSTAVSGFNPYSSSHEIELPYGTTAPPTLSVTAAEPAQKIEITQARTLQDPTTVRVTAADGTHTRTYTITFKVALLADNTLQDILVDGVSVAGFTPQQTVYRVSLPLGTTAIPQVKAVSAYPEGEQTIVYKAPETVDGGVYQISVTTPGNSTPRTYKLTFRIEASSYSRLKNLQVGEGWLTDFDPEILTYYISLPMGTTELPDIIYELGDPYQTVSRKDGGINGTTLITVKAANGAQSVYRIIFTTPLSTESRLEAIYLNGEAIDGFDPDTRNYTITLPIGTNTMPAITWQAMDEYEQVTVTEGGLNETTRLTVKAGDGSITVYQLTLNVLQSTDCSLKNISVNTEPLADFSPEKTDYTFVLPQGTTSLPEVSYELQDPTQRVTVRKPSGLTGDYRLTVRAESGDTRTYTIHFVVIQSSNTALQTIRLDGVDMADYEAQTLEYTVTLATSKLPEVEAVKGDATQRILSVREGNTQIITVTAEDGSQSTYTIHFVVQKSESAFLKMIYLDGEELPGFTPEQLTYTYALQTATCPQVTVDKEEGQHITIAMPYAAGEGQIQVQSETGEKNLYIITFTTAPSGNVQLTDILLDGVSLSGFNPSQADYSLTVSVLPEVQPVTQDGQKAVVVWNEQVASVYVTAGYAVGTYTLTFAYEQSHNCSLQAILADNTTIAGFTPEQADYTISLAADADIPTLTYLLQETGQTAWMGQQVSNKWQIVVQAPDGTTQQTYTITFDRALHDDATLIDIQAVGHTLNFSPDIYTYTLPIETGTALPTLTLTTRPKQHTLTTMASEYEQQIWVTAESGRTATYTITYLPSQSHSALLQDIMLNGKSLEGFEPDIFNYTYTLAAHSLTVPAVHPVGQSTEQTITTYHSRVGGTTHINVVSSDGATQADYYISFPVESTGANTLASVEIDEAIGFHFDPAQTDYTILLPYGTTAAPQLYYTRLDNTQQVAYTAAPLNGVSLLRVTAQDGTQTTYSFRFKVEEAEGNNRLQALTINGLTLDTRQAEQTVTLPYGTNDIEVNYTKAFAEQTVTVVEGGLTNPTTITVRSNREDNEVFVYTITPNVTKHNPAVLASIEVNGVAIDGFDPMVYNYVVNVTDVPSITATAAEGAEVTVSQALNKKTKSIQFTATSGEYSHVYTVSYYFTNCTPPFDFTGDWVKASKGNGYKPTSAWKVPADYDDGYTWTIPLVGVPLTYSTGKEVTQSGNGVLLSTLRGAPIKGSVPGMMTLGGMSLSLSSNGNSTSSITQNATTGITFRNTPEQFAVRVKPLSTNNISNWKIWLTMSDGSNYKNTAYTGSFTPVNTWQEIRMNIAYPQNAVTKFNLLLNSGDQENAGEYGGSTVYTSDVQMENLRFIYNSQFASVTVDGNAATINGTDISYTISNPEYDKFPEVEVKGQVHDQMQHFTWQDEVNGVRTATLRNYGEDGSFTDYHLTITRTLSPDNRLKGIYIDNTLLTGFSADENDYVYTLANGTRTLPDLQVKTMSPHAQTSVTYNNNLATIIVTAETGETRTYTVQIREQKTNDTRLAMLTATGLSFDADQRTYRLQGNELPNISFVKLSDGQTVTLNNGIVTVIAEDGTTKGEYRVEMEYTTSGQLNEWLINGVQPADFRPNNYDYTLTRPDLTQFVMTDDLDSVVFIQTKEQMQWQVYGYEQATTPALLHTYTLTYPVVASDNANLQGITVDGKALDEFSATDYQYTISTDTTTQVVAQKMDDKQQVSVTYADSTYTLLVTAENGAQQTYTVALKRTLSDISTLRAIYVGEEAVSQFAPATTAYTVTLPAEKVKKAEPAVPSISYECGHSGQKVEIQTGALGETTYLIVTAEDGVHSTIYELTIAAEPSHNASLTAIVVNGVPVEHFEQGRHYYSAQATGSEAQLTWAAEDNFQTYSLTQNGSEYTITVTAQDGTTTETYMVDVFFESLPNDATLRQIWLNGIAMDEFEVAINPRLSFDSHNNRYTVNLPAGTEVMPAVSAGLKTEGQTVEIRTEQMSDSLSVTAPDGITQNTYVIDFVVPQSNNTQLSMIYLNSEPLASFAADTRFYSVALPIGTHSLPQVFAQKEETTQTVDEISVNGQQMTITVHAEDGTIGTYILLFTYTPSDANQLKMVYADNDSIQDFASDKYNYYIDLPIGTRNFPALTYDSIDEWQHIETREVYRTQEQQTTQIEVQAESGTKNIYTITFNVLQSAADTLKMIYVNNQPLKNFHPYITEYSDTLPTNSTSLPKVEYEAGDTYQIIGIDTLVDALMTKSLGQKLHIEVQAQNRSRRTYILHFPIALSQNTQLAMIWNNGLPLSGFNKELLEYDINIPYDEKGQRLMPAITVSKAEEEQNVDIMPQGDSLLLIRVMAEDGIHFDTYQMRFHYGLSPITTLSGIRLNGQDLQEFQPEVKEYTVQAFVDDELPSIDWLPGINGQELQTYEPTFSYDSEGVKTALFSCDVTAPDGEHYDSYSVAVTFSLTAADTVALSSQLQSLAVKGIPVSINSGFDYDFHTDTLHYTYQTYPHSTRNDAFFSDNDVTYTTIDPQAQVLIEVTDKEMQTDTFAIEEDGTAILRIVERRIDIVVTNRKGLNTTIYTLQQQVALSHDSTIAIIRLNNIPYMDFDPEIHEYTYPIKSGTTPPAVSFEPADPYAFAADVVSDEYMQDSLMVWTRTIICQSEYAYAYERQNPLLRNTYVIRFVESPLNEADSPWENDVLVKQLPYSSQVAFASIRSGVQIALYDANGQMLFFRMLDATSPSNAIVTNDSYGRTIFTDVQDISQCMVTTLERGKIYFYCFYKAGKKRIKTGKIMLQ